MKVALYLRVSTENQTTENQRTDWKNMLSQIMNTIVWWSRKYSKNKTCKQALLAKLRANKYDAVVIYKLDRWARSSRELILDTKELVDKGIGFISFSDNLDLNSASGKLHFHILSAFAEFERSLISERTKEGLKHAKSIGKTNWDTKGSKDKNKRRKSGYILREANKKRQKDENSGVFNYWGLFLIRMNGWGVRGKFPNQYYLLLPPQNSKPNP